MENKVRSEFAFPPHSVTKTLKTFVYIGLNKSRLSGFSLFMHILLNYGKSISV